jgi:hypothetical protein
VFIEVLVGDAELVVYVGGSGEESSEAEKQFPRNRNKAIRKYK